MGAKCGKLVFFIFVLILMVWFVMQMCKCVEPLNFDNGKPCIPVIKDHTLPGFMSMDPGVPRGGDSRIRIFSGTANPALAQVSFV